MYGGVVLMGILFLYVVWLHHTIFYDFAYLVILYCALYLYILMIKQTGHEGLFFINGFMAERRVLEELQKLSDNYFVYRDPIKTKSGNVDFFVIGPTGIFAIEVKSNKVQLSTDKNGILYSGSRLLHGKDPIKQVKKEALEISNTLRHCERFEYVQPILVFTRASQITFGNRRQDSVYVAGVSYLKVLIEKNQIKIHPKLVEQVVACMDRACHLS